MATPTKAIKKSLVEEIFRRTWEKNAALLAEEQEKHRAEQHGDSDSGSDLDERGGRSDKNDASTDVYGAFRVAKINTDALKLSAEYLRVFLVEALQRAQMEAMVDDSEEIEPRHIEQILAQLLLDF